MIKSGVLIWTVLNMSKQQLVRLPVLPFSFQLVINNFYQNVQQRYIFHWVFPLKVTLLHKNSYKCSQVPNQNSHSFVNKNRRLPVTCTDEIEQILNDNADIISEYAAFLGCAESSVRNMVRCETRLVTSFSKHEVLAKMKLLLDHGLHGDEITQRYYIFYRSVECIRYRLEEIKSVEHYQPCTYLLVTSDQYFKKRIEAIRREIAIMGKHPSQVSFVAGLLECSEEEVLTKAEDKCKHLLTMLPSRLQELVQILQEFGVPKRMMLDKCSMLTCTPSVARERLKCVKDAGVYDTDKLVYILNAKPDIFHQSVKYWLHNITALGGFKNEKEYLMQRLQCSETDIQSMFSRKIILPHLRAAKLKCSLDILINKIGISARSIIQYPELLFYSKSRLLSRWELLQQQNLEEKKLVQALILPDRKFHAQFM